MNKIILVFFALVINCLLLVVSQTGCGSGVATNTTTTTSTSASTSLSTSSTSLTTSTLGTSTTTTTATTTTTTLPRIFGTVRFAQTNYGVKNGVTINYTGQASGIVTTDANTGTYEITGLSNGTYALAASKSRWIASTSETVSFTGTSVIQNFTLNPTSWEVVHYDTGQATIEFIAVSPNSETVYSQRALAFSSDKKFIVSGAMDYTTWTDKTATNGYPTNESIPIVGGGGTGGGGLIMGAQSAYGAILTSETTGWTGWDSLGLSNPVTTEAIKSMAIQSGSDFTILLRDQNTILHTTNGGSSYTDITPPGAPVLNSLDIAAINNYYVIVVGENGYAYINTNATPASNSWSQFSNLPEGISNKNLIAVSMGRSNNNDPIIITTSDGSIYLGRTNTTNITTLRSDTTWETNTEGIPYNLKSAYVNGATNMLIGAPDGIIMRYR